MISRYKGWSRISLEALCEMILFFTSTWYTSLKISHGMLMSTKFCGGAYIVGELFG